MARLERWKKKESCDRKDLRTGFIPSDAYCDALSEAEASGVEVLALSEVEVSRRD